MKTRAKSTTGPQDAKCRCGIARAMYYECGSCGVIMNARYFENVKSEQEAAARERIIVAAPELLEALKALMVDAPRQGTPYPMPKRWAAAYAVIAKAEGR